MSPRKEQQTSGRKQQDIIKSPSLRTPEGQRYSASSEGSQSLWKEGEESRGENEGAVSAIGRMSRPGEAAEPKWHSHSHLWGGRAGPTLGDSGEPRPKPPDPGSQEPGPELTVHGLLLEEGRHGERPRRGGPARPGSVRPGSGEGTAERTEPGGGGGWQGWGAGVGSRDPSCDRRGSARLLPTRPGRSGDRELRHFLEKSLLGGACACCGHACALRVWSRGAALTSKVARFSSSVRVATSRDPGWPGRCLRVRPELGWIPGWPKGRVTPAQSFPPCSRLLALGIAGTCCGLQTCQSVGLPTPSISAGCGGGDPGGCSGSALRGLPQKIFPDSPPAQVFCLLHRLLRDPVSHAARFRVPPPACLCLWESGVWRLFGQERRDEQVSSCRAIV